MGENLANQCYIEDLTVLTVFSFIIQGTNALSLYTSSTMLARLSAVIFVIERKKTAIKVNLFRTSVITCHNFTVLLQIKKNIARLITEENQIKRKKRTQTQGLWLNSWFQGLVVETIGGEGQFWLRKDTFFGIHPVIDREIKPSTFHILDRNLKETTRWVLRLYAAMNVLRRVYSFQMCTFQWKHKTIQFTAHLF